MQLPLTVGWFWCQEKSRIIILYQNVSVYYFMPVAIYVHFTAVLFWYDFWPNTVHVITVYVFLCLVTHVYTGHVCTS